MLFSSMVFIWIFLPLCLLGYNLIPKTKTHARNIFLLIASFVFYAWGGIYYFLIMFSSIVINYFGGLLVNRFSKKQSQKKLVFILVIVLNLAILFYFKYFNFLLDIINNVVASEIELLDIVLPIGISFYTFQALSYVIDVYLEKSEVQKNFVDLALYISFFPQLIAGPIVKYNDINQGKCRSSASNRIDFETVIFLQILRKALLNKRAFLLSKVVLNKKSHGHG